jgi:gamma-glutamylcysteine synthetase
MLAERSAGNLHVAAKKGIRRTVPKKQQTLKAATTTKLTTSEKKITSHKIKSPERSEQAHNENEETFTNRREKSPNKSPNREHQHHS